MTDNLRVAREELDRAIERGGDRVREQLYSIEEGVFEEIGGGERTQPVPGPKADRIAELEDKLGGLAEEAEEPTQTHIERAREHLVAFREERVEE